MKDFGDLKDKWIDECVKIPEKFQVVPRKLYVEELFLHGFT